MGEFRVEQETEPEQLRVFMQRILDDLRAVETMLAEGLFESGVARIGAEQEMVLVDSDYRPAPVAGAVLKTIDDTHFTTELARFNLEANLDPLPLSEHCLRFLEEQLDGVLTQARRGAEEHGADVLLTGILPTLDKSDLGLDNMAPVPRYFALAEAVRRIRGSEFDFHIRGRDELTLRHDSVMMEACNTSFQLHFQVDAEAFVPFYNIAQLLAAPVLAAAANSPLLFGKRLWRETRIAVFRQSVDVRRHRSHRRQQSPRVSFGERWIDESVVEIFREDISRFRLLLARDLGENPLDALARGVTAPALQALFLHNGTVYRWNRPCYGVTDGKAHLRIENRILPAGPTVVDEVANAAFWIGALKAIANEYGDVRSHLGFGAVKENFLAAARQGLEAQLHWLDGRSLAARELICGELLPRARGGLRSLGIASEDSDRYLDIVEERVRSRLNGSQWMLGSLAGMRPDGSSAENLATLTAAMITRQHAGEPVHTWPLAKPDEAPLRHRTHSRVSSLMTTDLFTVHENEVVDLVASLMDWKHIRHVPVEDDSHRLVGLVTHRILLRVLVQNHGSGRVIAVRDVMEKEVVTVAPDTPTLEALALLKKHQIACLPVVEDDRLVGVLTEHDLMRLADELLTDFLSR